MYVCMYVCIISSRRSGRSTPAVLAGHWLLRTIPKSEHSPTCWETRSPNCLRQHSNYFYRNLHACMYVCMQVYMIYIHSNYTLIILLYHIVFICIHTYKHHTYLHTCINTYIHTYSYPPMYDEASGKALLSSNSFSVKAWKEYLMKEMYGAHEPSQVGNLGM